MNGLFDISFDDGSFESNIPRRRIRLELATESKAHQMTAFALMKSKERKFKRERFSRKHRERESKKAEGGFEFLFVCLFVYLFNLS